MPRYEEERSASINPRSASINPRRIVGGVAAVILTIVAVICSFSLFQNVDADEILVVQHPTNGHLTFHSTPGIKLQGFGKVTLYKKRQQFWFSAKEDQGRETDDAIKIRFNDGGHADVSGSTAWEMPLDEVNLTELHTKYGSPSAIEQQLIRTIVEKCVYMTGPLMSSAESYASRRNELLSLIDDQIKYGVYRTTSKDVRAKDPMTGQDKTVRLVELVPSDDPEDHGFAREGGSPISDFGIKTFNLSLNEVTYDQTVESQIQQQQQAIMQVQTAIADSKRAEQKAITVAKEGEADAAKAKWEQEVIKAREVTSAEQRVAVAVLDLEAAELEKKRQILLGEGEAKRRELVMSADGALDKKLEAYVKVNEMFAKAISEYRGAWVPGIVMGSSANGASSGANAAFPGANAMDFINLLTMKAAKDLSLNLGIEASRQPVQTASVIPSSNPGR